MKWKEQHIILSLILVQLLVCVPVLNLFPIALDEPFTIFHAQLPLTDLLAEIGKGNNSPLHFVALHFWMEWFGNSPFAVRILSVLVSVALVIVLYKFARKLTNRTFSVFVVGLFIFSRLNHYVSMEARMYGFFTVFFLLILYYSYEFIFEDKKRFLHLAIFNALLLYTHYLGAIVLLMELGVVLLFYKQITPKKWKEIGFTFVLGVLFFIPGILFFFSRVDEFASNGTWVPATKFVDLWMNLVKLLNNEFAFFVTLGACVILMLANRKKELSASSKTHIIFLLYWFIGLFFLFFVISMLLQPIFIIRYLQFLTIPLYLLIGWTLSHYYFTDLNKNWIFILLLPFVLSFKFVPDTNRETDKLVKYVQDLKGDETLVYYCPPHYNYTLAYYLNANPAGSPGELVEALEREGYVGIYHGRDIDLSAPALIYIDFESQFLYENNAIISTLDREFTFLTSRAFKGNFNVYAYVQRK